MFSSHCEVCSHSGVIMISRDIINSGTFQNNLFSFTRFFFGDQAVNLGVYFPEITRTKVSVPFYQ